MKICFIVQLGNTNRVFRHKYGDIGDYKKKSKPFYYTLHKISWSSTTKLETDIELIRVILFPHISPSSPLRHEMNVMINFFPPWLFFGYCQRKVFSMIKVWGSSFVSPLGGARRLWIASSGGEQHILLAQAFPQERLHARGGGGEGSSLWITGEAPSSLPNEVESNSGWTVQQLTPALRSTLVTPDIISAHLHTCEMNLHQ